MASKYRNSGQTCVCANRFYVHKKVQDVFVEKFAQAVREPRPDTSYLASGVSGLQIKAGTNNSVDENGYQGDGSRVIQWGWIPVGGASSFDTVLTPNYLIAIGQTGTVTIST